MHSEIIEILEGIFSSPGVLNGSFLKPISETEGDYIQFVVDPGLAGLYEKLLAHDEISLVIEVSTCSLLELIVHFEEYLHGDQDEALVHIFIVIMENPLLRQGDSRFQNVLARLCTACILLSVQVKKAIMQEWSKWPAEVFSQWVNTMQTFLSKSIRMRKMKQIEDSAQMMELFYYANETVKYLPKDRFHNEDITRYVDFQEDYFRWIGNNDISSDSDGILVRRRSSGSLSDGNSGSGDEMQKGSSTFSFCDYPFLLDVYAKSKIIIVEAMMQQTEAMGQSMVHDTSSPYLVLRIRRDHILEDSLSQLMVRETELKKQLKIIFEGEIAVDEGGVTNEWFAMLLRELSQSTMGLFTVNKETGNMWFMPDAPTREFKIIGMIMGLAIYNNVILDIRFPKVLYKKLLDFEYTPNLADLYDIDNSLALNLQKMLSYEDDDFEEVFGLVFQIQLPSGRKVNLKERGESLQVTKENRKEFVDLYVRYSLGKSVEKQFMEFYRGFMQITAGPAFMLFEPSELELLICGQHDLDLVELEKVTKYDGYTQNSPVVRFFWSYALTLDDVSKRKLLKFCTGSDRSPVGGLSRLEFLIQRAGPDSDSLPTAHTCFNTLLLPEYGSEEKLSRKMTIAIENAEGFGLI